MLEVMNVKGISTFLVYEDLVGQYQSAARGVPNIFVLQILNNYKPIKRYNGENQVYNYENYCIKL